MVIANFNPTKMFVIFSSRRAVVSSSKLCVHVHGGQILIQLKCSLYSHREQLWYVRTDGWVLSELVMSSRLEVLYYTGHHNTLPNYIFLLLSFWGVLYRTQYTSGHSYVHFYIIYKIKYNSIMFIPGA